MTPRLIVDARAEGCFDQIASAIVAIDEELNELERSAAALRQYWNGAAASAYESAHRDWDDAVRELQGIAARLARIGRSGAARLAAQDRAHAAVWAL